MWPVLRETEALSSPLLAFAASSSALLSLSLVVGSIRHAALRERAYCGALKDDDRPRKTSEIKNGGWISQGHCCTRRAESRRAGSTLGGCRAAVDGGGRYAVPYRLVDE